MTELIPSNLSAPQPQTAVDWSVRCAYCGCAPAADTTFRGHRGIILVMQFLKQKGPFCRDCGTATFRTMTSRTLVQGWWGYGSFVITPFVLLMNLFRARKVTKLAAPVAAPDGSSGQPMAPGKPLYLRPTIAGLLVPLAIISVIGYGLAFGKGPQDRVGECVQPVGTEDVNFVSCDQTNVGKVIKVVDAEADCPEETTGVVDEVYERRRGRDTHTFYCLVKS